MRTVKDGLAAPVMANGKNRKDSMKRTQSWVQRVSLTVCRPRKNYWAGWKFNINSTEEDVTC